MSPARQHRKYVVHDKTDGVDRWYFRRQGQPKVRLPGFPGSDEFNEAYYAALNATGRPAPKRADGLPRAQPDTFRWLGEQYLASAEAKQLEPTTLRVRRLIFQSICSEPTKPGAKTLVGDMPLQFFGPKVVGMLMDRKADAPEAANGRRLLIRSVFRWAMKPARGHVASDPTRDVDRIRTGSSGHHSWTDDEIEAFEKRHPIGTKPRLALDLLLYLTQRRSDIVAFGRQHVKAGWLHFTQFKGRNRNPVTLDLPIVPELQASIDACARAGALGDLTFLVTAFGKPFTAAGFGNWFRDRCDEAGLKHCSAHGLRKAGARRLAERGKSGHQIKAVTGHRTLKEVDRYTEAARQKLLAESALLDETATKVSSRGEG
jgi:integrase